MEKTEVLIQPETELTPSELQRYSRHLVMPEVGIEGQKKLKAAKVLLIGAGGLGSPVGMYLAAAGVGTIGIVENDDVSLSNLQRQILFVTDDVGNSKSALAEFKLKEINPEITVNAYDFMLTSDNALEIIKDYDIVVDGSDNFATRYLVNDACVMLNKPFVSGSILKFEGQVSFFNPAEGPCYRCLFPEPPKDVPSCSEAGVLGVLPGVIGSLMANEVIKFIIGKGELLQSRLLKFDALNVKFTELHFEKDENCAVCSGNPLITELIDYENFCNPTDSEPENTMTDNFDITVEQLKEKMDKNEKFVLLDIREPFEKEIADLGGVHIPFDNLLERMDELNKEDEIVVYCHVGGRSYYAVEFMKNRAGFKNVKNLHGGVDAWAEKIDSSMQRY